jgi:hypothetical protein
MIPVNVDNFRAAETALVLDNQLVLTGGINRWFHYREPTPVDKQPVIRMNRDTLYSGSIVDISEGGTVRRCGQCRGRPCPEAEVPLG